jgi:hypothetical protein
MPKVVERRIAGRNKKRDIFRALPETIDLNQNFVFLDFFGTAIQTFTNHQQYV